MAEEVEVSFADAFGGLGTKAPDFIGRIVFADFIQNGEVVRIENEDPGAVIIVYSYATWSHEYMGSPTVTYDAAANVYTIAPGPSFGGRFFIAGAWL